MVVSHTGSIAPYGAYDALIDFESWGCAGVAG